MSKPGGDPSSGISSGEPCSLPERHPACRRREAQPGSCTERENLSLRCQGRRPSGAHRKDHSTEAEHRGGAARSVCLTADVSGGLKSHSARGPGLISKGEGNASPAEDDGKVWRG